MDENGIPKTGTLPVPTPATGHDLFGDRALADRKPLDTGPDCIDTADDFMTGDDRPTVEGAFTPATQIRSTNTA